MNGPDSGWLDRRITIQQRASGLDSFGQSSIAWTDYLSCWARIEPLSGHELVTAQAVNAEVTHKVTVLYRPGITAAMRAVYQGRYFNVQNVLDPETAHVISELHCSEGLNPG